MVVQYTENTQLSTSESVARQMTETLDENFDTEQEIAFDEFTIPADYTDCDIFEE